MSGKKARQQRQSDKPTQPLEPFAVYQGQGHDDPVEQACDADRAYFRAHLAQDSYVRSRLPGEFGPAESDAALVGCTQVRVESWHTDTGEFYRRIRTALPARKGAQTIAVMDEPTVDDLPPLHYIKEDGKQVPVQDERYVRVMEAVSARDRAWFLAHPDTEFYVRKRVPGEFGDNEGDPEIARATHTRVEKIPGGRKRLPMILLRARDYPSGVVPFEHAEAAAAITSTDPFPVDDDQIDDR